MPWQHITQVRTALKSGGSGASLRTWRSLWNQFRSLRPASMCRLSCEMPCSISFCIPKASVSEIPTQEAGERSAPCPIEGAQLELSHGDYQFHRALLLARGQLRPLPARISPANAQSSERRMRPCSELGDRRCGLGHRVLIKALFGERKSSLRD